MFSVSNKLDIISNDQFWMNLERKGFIDDEDSQSEVFEIFYWLNSGLFSFLKVFK